MSFEDKYDKFRQAKQWELFEDFLSNTISFEIYVFFQKQRIWKPNFERHGIPFNEHSVYKINKIQKNHEEKEKCTFRRKNVLSREKMCFPKKKSAFQRQR